MSNKSNKTIFTCQSCGYVAPKWMGKCTECGRWDTFVEETKRTNRSVGARSGLSTAPPTPVPIDAIELDRENRLLTGITEFDRVLGGGLVPGTLILIGGDPGIGKSTLMLQTLYGLAETGHKALYVSGEESVRQLRLRSKRLSAVSSNIYVISEIDLEAILPMVESIRPSVIVVDSIQTMFSPELTSARCDAPIATGDLCTNRPPSPPTTFSTMKSGRAWWTGSKMPTAGSSAPTPRPRQRRLPRSQTAPIRRTKW